MSAAEAEEERWILESLGPQAGEEEEGEEEDAAAGASAAGSRGEGRESQDASYSQGVPDEASSTAAEASRSDTLGGGDRRVGGAEAPSGIPTTAAPVPPSGITEGAAGTSDASEDASVATGLGAVRAALAGAGDGPVSLQSALEELRRAIQSAKEQQAPAQAAASGGGEAGGEEAPLDITLVGSCALPTRAVSCHPASRLAKL